MERYQARYNLHEALEEIEAETMKDPFLCLIYEIDPNTGQPKIDPKTGHRIKKSYPIYEAFIAERDDGTKEPFKPAKVAKWIDDNENFKTDMKTEIVYYYDGKFWTRHGEPYLRKIISQILGDEEKESLSRNVQFALRNLTLSKIDFCKKIAVENGLLNLETNPIELEPFSPKEMTFYSLPVTYNPSVDPHKIDNWLEFLKQVAHPDDIPLLQEWFGYCLLPSFPFHKTLWIYGKGRNGKGVFDRTIQGILGADNVHSFRLEYLDERFALKDFYGKLYAVSSEPASNRIFRTETFQKLTGGDRIEAEFKGKNEKVSFPNCAKITIIGNKFSRVDNPTDAFKDRMMFVKFTRFFSDGERIHDLEKIWLNDPEQRSAILNWALEGLVRLYSQNGFTKTKEQEQTEIEFERISNPESAFQKDVGIIAKGLVTTRTAALEAYQQYSEAHGIPLQKNYQSAFTKQMQTLAPKVRDGWTKVEGKNQRAWINFGLKTNGDQPQQPQQPHHFILTEFGDESSKNIENKKGVVSVVNVASSDDKVLHFNRTPPNERHGCDNCHGLEAVFQQGDNYFCQDCFKSARTRAEADGCVLVEDFYEGGE